MGTIRTDTVKQLRPEWPSPGECALGEEGRRYNPNPSINVAANINRSPVVCLVWSRT